MWQVSTGHWVAAQLLGEEGWGGQALSEFTLSNNDGKVEARLHHLIQCTDSSVLAETNGSGDFSVQLIGGPNTEQSATVVVDVYYGLEPGGEGDGEVAVGDLTATAAGRPRSDRKQFVYQLQVGQSVPIPAMHGNAEINGSGNIEGSTTVIISITAAPAVSALTGGGWNFQAVYGEDDDDDDEVDPDPDPCKKKDVGDALHLRLTTGNFWTHVPILKTEVDGEPEFDLTFRYDTLRLDGQSYSYSAWTHDYSELLYVLYTPPSPGMPWWEHFGKVVYVSPNGRCNVYHFNGYIFSWSIWRSQFMHWTNGEFVIEYPDGSCHYFDSQNPRVKRIIDRRGRITRFTYYTDRTEILSPYGRLLTLHYANNSAAKISKVTGPDNEETFLYYDASGDLIEIKDPLNNSTVFEYDPVTHRMTRETLKNNKFYTAEYETNERRLRDMDGNIIAKVNCLDGFPDNRRVQITPSQVLQHTDARGNTSTIQRDNWGRIVTIEAPSVAGTGPAIEAWQYGNASNGNDNGRVIAYGRKYDSQEDVWHSHWDANGNVIEQIDALGNPEIFEYAGPFRNLLTKHTTQSETGNIVWEYKYYLNGDLKEIIDPIIDGGDPNTDHKTEFYYEDHPAGTNPALPGRIKSIRKKDRHGNQTFAEFNTAGERTTVTRGYGSSGINLVTRFEYDLMRRETARIVERDANTTIRNETTYDEMGRILTTVEDAGSSRLNLTTTRTYDEHGRLKTLTNPRGKVTTFDYDNRNRLIRQTVDPSGLHLVTEWEPDGNGNIHSVTDPNEHVTTYEYDERNHLTLAEDAEGYRTRYHPDGAGRFRQIERDTEADNDATTRSVWYEYDALDRVTFRTLTRGGGQYSTTYSYTDFNGGPPCGCGKPTPDSNMPWKIVDGMGRTTYLNYDPLNRLVSVVRIVDGESNGPVGDTNDAVTYFDYDLEDNLTGIHGPEGQFTRFEYDVANRLHKKEVATSPSTFLTTIYARDGADNITNVTLPNGNYLTLQYDRANRPLHVGDLLGQIARYEYDENGNIKVRADGLEHTWQYEYDAADRLTRAHDPLIESPIDTFLEYAYDASDNLTRKTDQAGVVTKYVYDAIDRLVTTIEDFQDPVVLATDTTNTTTEYGYDGIDQTSITDNDWNTTYYEYTDDFLLKKIIYPAPGGTVEYDYDFAGNLAFRKDQRDIETWYWYDELYHLNDRNYFVPPPGAGWRFEHFEFDRSGRLTSAEGPDGRTASFTYDILNRVKTASQTFETGGFSAALSYDYVVAANDVRRTVHYPGGRDVTHSFDLRSRLADVAGGTGVGATWSHDLSDRHTQAVRPNGIRDTFGYDADDRLTSISSWLFPSGGDPSPVDLREFGYNAVGNRMFTRLLSAGNNNQTARSELYSHDNRNRLRSMLRGVLNAAGDDIVGPTTDTGRAASQSWTGLDPRGNWTEFHESPVGLPEQIDFRNHNAVNQISEIEHHDGIDIGTLTPTHDDAGNLTFEPRPGGYGPTNGGLRYTYDEENRVTSIRRGGDNALVLEIKYDAIGRRVETIEHMNASGPPGAPQRTRHLYDGLQVVRDYICGMDNPPCSTWGSGREYIWGDARRFPEPIAMIDYTPAGEVADQPEVFHYLRDVLGTVVGLTDENGALVERYSSDPYGKTFIETWDATTQIWSPALASPLGNPFLWTGQRYDATTATYHFWARTYSPTLGRWLQQDPLGYVDSANLYQCVLSDPLWWIDPLGLKKVLRVYVDQPGSGGDRDPYEFGDGGSKDKSGLDVGHTFVEVVDTDTGETTGKSGLYPAPNATIHPKNSPKGPGVVRDDTDHPFDASKEFELTDDGYDRARDKIARDKANPPEYDLNGRNCTGWGLECAHEAGVEIRTKKGKWYGGGGPNPGDLGQDLRQGPTTTQPQSGNDCDDAKKASGS